MRIRFRLAAAVFVAAGVVLSASGGAAAASSDGWVYHVRTYIHCADPDCAGTGVLPPWIKTLINPFDATTDGSGHFYHRASIIAIGRSGNPRQCNRHLFDKPFSGRCVVRDFGIGYIAPGAAIQGKPDFFVSSETAQFGGGLLVADPFAPYPIDTYQIASPGHYSTSDQLGSKPDGVTLIQDVTRTHR